MKKERTRATIQQKVQDYLTDLVLNKMIKIEEYGTDRYRRILAVIYVNGKNINLRMVQVGLAEAYKGRPAKGFNPQPYEIAEYEARKNKRGMWSQGDKYISPKEWRKRQKE